MRKDKVNGGDPRFESSDVINGPGVLKAKQYYSGFALAHDSYNCLTLASNGKIYYILSSDSPDHAGQFFCLDPRTDSIQFLADLSEICGESPQDYIPQGKSHVEFYEWNGKLFFGTHIGVYEMIGGMERLPQKSLGSPKLYRGGHILAYDLTTGEFEDLALIPDGEGILTMTMDTERAHIYALSWPTGKFVHYDVTNNRLHDMGPVSAKGEAGTPGEDYRVLCRSMFIDPLTASVYFSNSEGDILTYSPSSPSLRKLDEVNLRLDYFGQYDPTLPGSMGYNWRKIFWHPEHEVAYGVHGNSGYLFRFDPRKSNLEIIDRITSMPSRKSGMFDLFSYGYLGFQLGPDHETIYYLTGGPVYVEGKRVRGEERIAKGAARGIENLHLVTYHLPSGEYRDHGAVLYEDGERPTYVNSIAVTPDRDVYMLARYQRNSKVIQDIVKIESQF